MELTYADLENGVRKIDLKGRLDIEGATAIDLKFTSLAATQRAFLVIDMTLVDFIASLGVATLVRSAKAAKLRKGNKLGGFKERLDMPDDALTLDYIFDNVVIRGSVNRVVDGILALHERIGDFGTLLYCGKDWADPALSRRSMELMAEQVMPAVNAALGKRVAAE